MRVIVSFEPKDLFFRERLFEYLRHIPSAIVLETASNPDFNQKYSSKKINFLAGIGELSCYKPSSQGGLKEYIANIKDWALGFFAYDFKNQLEELDSGHDDGIQLPELLFIQPQYIIISDENGWRIGYHRMDSNASEALQIVYDIGQIIIPEKKNLPALDIQAKVSKKEYFRTVDELKKHIHRGDIYEINYCIEFFNAAADIDPYELYGQLLKASPVPFAAFAKIDNRYLVSASPERYLKKEGSNIFSQPIKGTAARHSNSNVDYKRFSKLNNSLKERSENIMITDLVRNDLSKVAAKGSVQVDELCGIYPFQQVYQMISTISATLDSQYDWYDAICNTFPMGSMTGAPKYRAMQLIEAYEATKRGLYSGAIGYITPDKDFDFNVVIRSLLYDQSNKYLSFMVGSAITSLSDPEEEYNECMAKVSAIKQVLGADF